MLLRSVIAVVLFLPAALGYAAKTVPIYTEDAILARDARSDEQSEVVEEALNRVLIRVTGDPTVVGQASVRSMLSDAESYLSTFRFERSDVTLTNVLGESVPTKRMIMRFDQGSIEDFLVRNRLPIWGNKRPETLVWLADRLEGAERVLSDGDTSELAEALREAAEERGVPLTLPIMDLDDTLNVSFTDIHGLFTANVVEASERYEPDATLVGRAVQQSSGYRADFVFLMEDDRRRFRVEADNREALMDALVDQLANRLADQYAVVLDPAMAGQISLRVNQVDDLATLGAVEAYLESLNLITQVTLRRVEPESIQLDLEISGDRNQLRDALALDRRLQPVEEDSLVTQLDKELIYEWIGQAE